MTASLVVRRGLATRVGEPDAGNLHVRFDEGEQRHAAPYSTVMERRSLQGPCYVAML